MNITQILPFINKPGRYIGGEYNITCQKADNSSLLFALVFPDLYEIGMSHQGLQILYHILNQEDMVIAERSYCPDPGTEAILKEKNIPLVSLESGRPLNRFDLIGITLPHELCYTNILTILDRADIAFLADERSESSPLIIGGGACAFNPEPVADFFDAILLGDGEEAVVEIARVLLKAKHEGIKRSETIALLAQIDGLYIPGNYQPEYDDTDRISRINTSGNTPPRVSKRILPDLDNLSHLKKPLVPNARIVHDRLGIEIARGCTRGCRFCQAGIIYRPVRERSVDQIMELAEQGIANSGFEELALLSLSTGDYSCLPELLPRLMHRYVDEYVSVSLPSMRVGTLTQELMDEIKRVRKTGFTLAPEAGSERLRLVINKGINKEDLLSAAADAFALGWNLIKLYFMIGLPTETMEDIDAIIDLAKATGSAGEVSGRGRRRVTVSVGTFVPKPHTPFQWEEQLSMVDSRERINHLKARIPKRGFKLKWHDPEQSYLEGVFARGDRRLATLIIKAWENGARLDSWSDHFNLRRWQETAASCNLNLDFYLRRRHRTEILPWQHLATGVTSEFLLEEMEHSGNGTYTPDCRYHGCQQCGLCDFDTIQPIVHNQNQAPPPALKNPQLTEKSDKPPSEDKFKYLVSYSRTGSICYLGHLDFLQIIVRGLKRAGIKTSFSQGYNPSPRVSFGPALPVGTESLCEFFIMELPEILTDCADYKEKLGSVLPTGITINEIRLYTGRVPQNLNNTYHITLDKELSIREQKSIFLFMQADEHIISRERKGKVKQLNIRPLIDSVKINSLSDIEIKIISKSSFPGIKPIDALVNILGRSRKNLLRSKVRKTNWDLFEQ